MTANTTKLLRFQQFVYSFYKCYNALARPKHVASTEAEAYEEGT